tara:strand:- start:4029 stop:5039 length:1011 start_codon:yes stop_codon:yes gene_type:complete
MKALKFGIAGFGKMGKIRARTIDANINTELVAIYEINGNNFKDQNVIECKSFDDLLRCEIDAIFICSYVSYAADYTIKALTAGKHVFCEKPPAMSYEEMIEVKKVEKQSRKILKYGFNHRYHFSVIEAKKIISKGLLGRLLWMRGFYGKAGSIDFNENWRNYKKYSGGGILFDQGIHMLDLFRFFSGDEFDCISSYLTTSYWNIECEDNAFLTLKSKNNVIATLHSSATQWKHKFCIEMTFEEGYINLDGILSETRSYAPEKLIYGDKNFEDRDLAMGKPKESITYFEIDKSWEFELEEFINSIVEDTRVVNGTSDDAMQIMKITDHVYKNSIISS